MKTQSILPKASPKFKGLALDPQKVVTNIVCLSTFAPRAAPPPNSARRSRTRNILCGAIGKFSVRMVTHYDVDRASIDRALAAVREVLAPAL